MITTTTTRTWKDLPGFLDMYQVSDDGLVRVSPEAPVNHYRAKDRGELVRAFVDQGGYVRMNVMTSPRKYASAHLHRLLALAFLGTPPSPGHQVNHKDGNKLNNSLSNLEWVTQKENLDHAWETGLRKKPTKPRNITLAQAREIRSRALSGKETMVEIAKDYPVTMHTVYQIKHGRQWKEASL